VQQDGIGIHQKISISGEKNLILGCSFRQKKENEKGKNKQRYLGYIIFCVLNPHGQYVRITLIRSKEERKN
jgi:hypothetical protein